MSGGIVVERRVNLAELSRYRYRLMRYGPSAV